MESKIFGMVMFFGLIANALWFYIKYIVDQNGYESSSLRPHLGHILNLHDLTNKEQNISKKKRFQYLLYAFYASLFLAIVTFIFMFFAF